MLVCSDRDRLPVPEYYMYGEEEEYRPPVPKRMRSVAGDWPTSMPLDSPSPHALCAPCHAVLCAATA